MSRAEVSKLTEYAVLGSPAASVSVSKLVMFAILVPGVDEGTETPSRQSFCYGQRIGRG